MKAIIGTAVGILGLGGLVVAGSNRPAAQAGPVAIGDRTAIASGQTLVDCGIGRQALVHPQANGASRDECGFKVQGTGRRPSEDDRAYEADAVAACCGQRVGLLRLEVSTLFGVREDEAVARLGVRIY